MKLLSLELTKFLCHTGPVLFEFGPGVTLLSGPNGVGKSALLEGILWAIWGFVPSRPARIEGSRAVLKCSDQFTIDRSYNGRTESVDIGKGAGGKRRAEEEIAAHFGTYSAWERSLYVTGKNVSHFSSGNATTRWDHLERVTGALRFRELQKASAEDLTALQKSSEAVVQEVDALRDRILRAKSNFEDRRRFRELIYDDFNEPQLREDLKRLTEEFDRVEAQKSTLQDTLSEFEKEIQPLLREHRSLEEALQRVVYKLCETCGSSVPVEKDKSSLRDRLSVIKDEILKAKEVKNEFLEEISRLSSEGQNLLEEISDIKLTLAELARREDVLLQEEESCLKQLQIIFDAESRLLKLTTDSEIAYDRLKVGKDVSKALSPSGAPRRYLRQYLDRIGQYANYYLSALGSPIQVQLVVGDDNKTLDIKVAGIPAKRYEHASGGQQRRIDLCLLLAMAEAAAEVGTIPKDAPLIFDEALDTLDAEGVESLIFLACDIATRRQVLLVSHADPVLPLGTQVHHIKLGSNSWTPSTSV
jgi:DNA repair exonuclease SbcCD ATPase subunit